MNRFQLFLDTSSEELFRKATSELGNIFYIIKNAQTNEVEIVYFSGSRVAKFKGRVSTDFLTYLKAVGFEALKLEVEESTGFVQVVTK